MTLNSFAAPTSFAAIGVATPTTAAVSSSAVATGRVTSIPAYRPRLSVRTVLVPFAALGARLRRWVETEDDIDPLTERPRPARPTLYMGFSPELWATTNLPRD